MTPAEFKNRLRQKKTSPLTVLVGEEPFGFDELITLLRDTYLDNSNRDFNFHQFSAREAEIETVLNAARTYPFLAPNRLVVLRNLHELSSAEQGVLSNYFSDPAPETFLVMTAQGLEKKGEFSKLLQKHADWIVFPKLREYQLADLVRKWGEEKGYRFSSEALELFCHRSGTDQRRLSGELEKLIQFMGDRKNIEVEDVVAACSESGDASIFELLNAVGRRQLAESIICLQEQLEERAAPQFILTMLTRHFRQLWIISALHQQGMEKTAIVAKAGINRFFFDAMLEQALNYRACDWKQIFELLLETDKTLKTTGCSPGPVLEDFFWRLIGRRN